MTVNLKVHRTRRVHLVRFDRATTGDPDERYPDPDNRGYLGTEFGPVVGVLQGRTVTVRLTRLRIAKEAPLFVKSSDPAAFTVQSPSKGKLRSEEHVDIEIKGIAGGNPRIATLQVHFQSLKGPIIHTLTVWVLSPLNVAITPHVVTISQTGSTAAGVASVANIGTIMPLVKAIWIHYGVTFTVAAVMNETISCAAAGTIAWGELPTLLNTNWVPGSINVYMVPQITSATAGWVTLGYGFSRSSFATYHLPNPGIVLADGGGGITRTPLFWANDLAHEIGHFFTLWHPNNVQPPNEREETWARRMLMHNINLMKSHNNWKDNVGYGGANRGCLVTMKDLSQYTTDAECTTARNAITSPAGPY